MDSISFSENILQVDPTVVGRIIIHLAEQGDNYLDDAYSRLSDISLDLSALIYVLAQRYSEDQKQVDTICGLMSLQL